jgi:glycosyltransferase involved in cell wall biosynthesis
MFNSAVPTAQGRPRLGVVCDLVEENWPSMDLVGDMLLEHLRQNIAADIDVARIRPWMLRRFTAAGTENSEFAFKADRFLNRFWDYPKFLRRCRGSFDLFHLIDHSYAQLVLELPSTRTLVTCHDTETFRCLLEPEAPRSTLFRAMVKRTLRGLRKAAIVVCPTIATRDALLAHNLVPEERLRVVPLGAHPSCSAQPDLRADREADRLLGSTGLIETNLLHVGSTAPRKRIDILLRVFAEVKKRFYRLRLIHVGGPFTAEQNSLVDELQLKDSVLVLPYLESPVLAAVYRKAAALLLPSEREGFGLPVVEAMACATPVVTSDIAALREVGGDCSIYCPVGDTAEWTRAISALLLERRDPQSWHKRRSKAVMRAARFTWVKYAQEMAALYQEVLQGMNCMPGVVA